MAIFHTILHPTDFDAPSLEAFRVARELARTLGAKVVAFHVAAPPAAVTQDGRVILNPKEPTPVDLWAGYRAAQADSPGVAVEYDVVVGKEGDAATDAAGHDRPEPRRRPARHGHARADRGAAGCSGGTGPRRWSARPPARSWSSKRRQPPQAW